MSDADLEKTVPTLMYRVEELEAKIRGIPATVDDHGRRISLVEQTVTRFGEDITQVRSDLRDNFDLTRNSLDLQRETQTRIDTFGKLLVGLIALGGLVLTGIQVLG